MIKENNKEFETRLDECVTRVVDVFDDALQAYGICLSDNVEDVEGKEVGLQGTMMNQMKEQVETCVEDFLDDLHDNGLIYGIIFEDELVEVAE